MSKRDSDTTLADDEVMKIRGHDMNEKEVVNDAVTATPAEEPSTAALPVPLHFTSHSRLLNRLLWALLVISISSASFLYGFDLVVVASVQPNIVKDLGEVEKLPWITTSYLVSCMGTLLLWGRIYSHFNTKWTFVVAMLLFNAGSAVSASALAMNVFIGGRVLNGIGAIGIYAGSLNLITAITTIRQRTLYISFSTLAYGLSSAIAPVVSGAFAASAAAGWRWGFYLNICISVAFAPAYVFLLPSSTSPPRSVSLASLVRQFDLTGNILWACATSTLVTAISFGGALYEWNDGRIVGLLIASAISWILFVIQQWRNHEKSKDYRAFPVHLVRSGEMCNLWLQTFCANAAAFVPLTLVPLYFQFARGDSALGASLHLLPLVIGRMASSFLNGVCMRKYGYVMPWYTAGAAMALGGSVPFLLVDASTGTSQIDSCTFVVGFGSGLYLQSSFAVAQARSSADMVQKAITFINLGQIAGVAFPTAISNSIFINLATHMIEKVVPGVNGTMLQEAITASNPSSSFIGGLGAEQRIEVIQAFTKALQGSWCVVVAAAALSLLCSIFVSRQRLWK